MDNLKKWLIEQLKAEELKNTGNYPTNRQWRLKDWLSRCSMAGFKSTELKFNPLVTPELLKAGYAESMYEALVAPIKEEIKEWEKK